MKTLIIVRAPIVTNPIFQFDREKSLAKEVKEYWRFLHQGVTHCVSGAENASIRIIQRIRDELSLGFPHMVDEILDCEYRSTQIQERIFYLLEDQLRGCDTLTVSANAETAQYCLDFAKCVLAREVRENFIHAGEALLCLEGVGSTKILPSYRPNLRLVS